MSPLSQSPLGQPLVPRNRKGRELVVGPKTFSNRQPHHPKLSEEAGREGHPAEGGEREKR
jgi:hypothetical protein